MIKRISIFLAFALIAAPSLIATGCGGSGSEDETLSKSEFIRRADSLCRKVDQREAGEFAAYGRANAKSFNQDPEKGLEKAIRVLVLPSIRKEIEEIKTLGIPEGDEDQVEGFFTEVEAAIAKTDEDPLSIENSRPQSPFFPSYKLGRAYGFNNCAEMY